MPSFSILFLRFVPSLLASPFLVGCATVQLSPLDFLLLFFVSAIHLLLLASFCNDPYTSDLPVNRSSPLHLLRVGSIPLFSLVQHILYARAVYLIIICAALGLSDRLTFYIL